MNIFGTKNIQCKKQKVYIHQNLCGKPIAFKQKIVVVKRVYEEVTYR